MRFPKPLAPGNLVAVTSSSAGVPQELWPRLEFACQVVRDRGYPVVIGQCMSADGAVSAPAEERAAELMAFLLDPEVRAIIPPWGGELAIDLVALLDWTAIHAAEPTWLVGYSDLSTLLLPMTVRCDIATLNGYNLMDSPYRVPRQQQSWLDVVAMRSGEAFPQGPSPLHRAPGIDDWASDPTLTEHPLTLPGSWVRLDSIREAGLDVSGRLIGGCIETVANLAGTPYGDVPGFAERYREEGLILYLEAAESPAFEIARRLHGLRLAGWFDAAVAVLVGRTNAPDSVGFTQHQAVIDALDPLDIPVVGDVDCGHVAPYLSMVNGAIARVRLNGKEATITQYLG